MAWVLNVETGFNTSTYFDVANDLQASTLRISMKRGRQPGTCTFTVRDFGAGYDFPLEGRVIVFDGGTRVFEGRLRDRVRRDTTRVGQKLWDLSAISYTGLAEDVGVPIAPFNRPAESDAARVTFLVQTYGAPALDNVTVLAYGGYSLPASDMRPGSLASMLDQVASLTNGYWYVDNSRIVHYVAAGSTEGLTAPFSLSDTPNNSTSFGYDGFQIRESSSQLKTDVRFDSLRLTYSKTLADASAFGAYGHKYLYLADESLSTTAMVDQAVTAYLAGLKDPTYTITLNCYRGGLLPGQNVTIVHSGWGINAAYEVAGVDISVVSPSRLRYAMTFGDNQPDIANTLQQIAAGIYARRPQP
jgi:hypothetical protein